MRKGISEFLERRKARKAVERIFSSKVMETVDKKIKRGEFPTGPQEKHFQFLIVQVRDSDPNSLQPVLSQVIDLIFHHQGSVTNLSPSVLIVSLGYPWQETDSVESRLRMVASLIEVAGSQIRLAHGHCNGLAGCFGSSHRVTFGVAIPNFSEILKMLLNVPYGSAIEIP